MLPLLAARRNQIGEHVLVLSIVEPERKLVQVEGQIFRADVVICPDHAALEQRPERFD